MTAPQRDVKGFGNQGDHHVVATIAWFPGLWKPEKTEAAVTDSLKPGLLQINLERLFPSVYVQNHFRPCEIFSE